MKYICLKVYKNIHIYVHIQPSSLWQFYNKNTLLQIVLNIKTEKKNKLYLTDEETAVFGQGWQTFSAEGQRVNASDFGGHMVSTETSQLYHCSIKAAVGKI